MSDKFLTTGVRSQSANRDAEGPHTVIRHGSVSIPIYAGTVGGKVRYAIAFYLDGRRQRRIFTDIEKAKRRPSSPPRRSNAGFRATTT